MDWGKAAGFGAVGGMWDQISGKAGQRSIDQAHQQATGHLNRGLADSSASLTGGYDQAQGYLSGYGQQGQRANALYSRALGLDGAGPRQQFMDEFAGADPFRQWNMDQTARTVSRRLGSMGYRPQGGTMSLGLARAGMERGSQDYEGYMNRLAAAALQGQGIAGQQAGYAAQHGQGLAGLQSGFAQQHAGNAINFGNAQAQQSNALMQNLLGLGSLAVSAYTGMPTGGRPAVGSR